MSTQTYEDKTATADYIAGVIAELARMAAAAEYNVLAHLLQMARLESEQICGRSPVALPAPGDSEVTFTQISVAKFDSSNVVPLARAKASE
jgi:hypothetical protein